MARYRIVGARPKGERNHLKAEFHVYELAIDPKDHKEKWMDRKWKSIHVISDLIQAAHEVKTGKIVLNAMKTGDDVEFEMRVAHNGDDYKIGEMPDK